MTPQTTLPRDVPCLACGYNLRGLPIEHDCPECGQRIAAWVRADRFSPLDAAWLGRMSRGAAMLRFGLIAAPLLIVPGLVLAAWVRGDRLTLPGLGWLPPLRYGTQLLRTAMMVALPLVVPGLIVAAAGLWPLTSAPPQRIGGETPGDRATRLAARWFFGLGVFLGLLVLGLLLINLGGETRKLFGDWWAYDAAAIAAGALITLGLASAWRHLSQLARRLPDGDLARGFAQLRRDWFIAAGIVIAIALVTNLVNLFRDSAWVSRFGGGIPALLAGTPLVLTLLWLWWRTLRASSRLRQTLQALSHDTAP